MDYTNLYTFLPSSGIVVPNDKSVLLGIQTKFQEIFGTEIDLSSETPVGRLIEAFAVMVKTTLGVTAQTANQFNVNEATGVYLDSIAQIYDLKRIAGTKTRINIKCFFSSDSGTGDIPAGSMIMCGTNGELFSIDSPISNSGEVDDDGRFFGIGTATAVRTGPIVAAEGTVTSIQSSVLGWVGVTNVNPTYTGTDIETDEAFRQRIIASRPIGIGFSTHLTSALNRIDGVYSNCVLENNTGTSVKKKNVVIPPHSIFVGIDCIETDEILDTIAKEISRAKPVGTGMVDSGVPMASLYQRTVTYGYANGYEQTISFYRVVKTAILVSIDYSFGEYVGADIVSDINRVVAEYIATVGIGGVVYGSMIANRLINALNIGISSVWVQKNGSLEPADNFVEMDGYETPFTLAEYITATEVRG